MPIIIPPDQQQYDEFGRLIQPSPFIPQPMTQPIQMPAPMPVQPQVQMQPSMPIAPDFSPVPELPEQAVYRQEVSAIPQRADYKNGKLRTILNAIAGGLSGAAGHPEIGQQLHDAPYTQALQDYQRRTQAAKVGSDIATGRVKEGVAAGSAQSLDVSRRMNATVNQQNAKTKEGELDRKIDADVVKAERVRKLNEGIDAKLKADPKLDPFTLLYNADPEDIPAIIEKIKVVKGAGQKTSEQIAEEAKARTTGTLEAQDTPLGNRVAGTKAAVVVDARTNAEGNAITPDVVKNYQALTKEDPASATAFFKSQSQGAKNKLLQQAGIPKDLPEQQQNRMFSSRITLNHVDSAMQMATDPTVAKLLGPVSGRIEIIKGRVGSGEPTTLDYTKALENLKPDEARKMGEFLNFLNYMVIWESTTLTGNRPAQALVESLKSTGARASMTQDRLLGSLDAIKRSVNNTMEAIVPGSSPKAAKKTDPWDEVFKNMKVTP